MEILSCPDISFAVPQVIIISEGPRPAEHGNPGVEFDTSAFYLPPRVEVYSPQGELLPPGEAVGRLLNLLF